MRILIDNGSYLMSNLGDIAMLQVAVGRLRRLFPEAELCVLNERPARLHDLCPDTIPVNPRGRELWYANREVLTPIWKRLPAGLSERVHGLEPAMHRRFPGLCAARMCLTLPLIDRAELSAFCRIAYGTDLFLVSGGGFISDVFPSSTATHLATLHLAMILGRPAVMMGQGIGPLERPELRAMAAAVLPSIQRINLRESLTSRPLLLELGVPQERINVTGDDAVEHAVEAPDAGPGGGIGVNLRVTHYSGVNTAEIEQIRFALRHAAGQLNAPLIGVPIAIRTSESDVDSIRYLLPDEPGLHLSTPESVADLLALIDRCRIVVTGSYHAGVFSLSRGVPVIALAKSSYYVDKFNGLAGQFGAGCTVLRIHEPGLSERLGRAMRDAWDSAPAVRGPLVAAARAQAARSREAYDALAGSMTPQGILQPSLA